MGASGHQPKPRWQKWQSQITPMQVERVSASDLEGVKTFVSPLKKRVRNKQAGRRTILFVGRGPSL
ncbi:hypothetical protein O9929_19185 [Vibrio lentus]|nr:hypothetical protein [Vibrio lentus]